MQRLPGLTRWSAPKAMQTGSFFVVNKGGELKLRDYLKKIRYLLTTQTMTLKDPETMQN